MAIDTKDRRHVALLDQDVIFPDAGAEGTQDRAWMLQAYFDAFDEPPPFLVPGAGSISDGLSADFYGGTTAVVTPEALSQFNVALDGRQLLIDVKRYSRTILDSATPQTDDAAEAGEKSLSRSGFWPREQTDWSFGAGQEHYDIPGESNRSRFEKSKGADIWTRRRLCMLSDTALRFVSVATNIDVFSVGGRLYLIDAAFLRHTANPDVETITFDQNINCTDTIIDWATDGARIYLASGGAIALKRVDVGGAAVANHGALTPDIVEFVNGRLIGADGAALYEIDNAGAMVGTGIRTDPRTGFVWQAIAGMPGAAFIAANIADVAEIWATTVDDTSTALAAPTYAGGLPYGETINCMVGYPPAGLVIIGTSLGIRVATVDALKLSIHERIDIAGGVRALTLRDRFCWFTWSNPDTETTGLGRLDLSLNTSNATLVPPYAEDLQARNTQGTVRGVASLGSRRYFAVQGSGLWGETEYRVPVATIKSGQIRYSVLADKIFTGVNVRHDPIEGTVGATVIFQDGTERTLGSAQTGGSTVSVLDSAQGSGLSASLRLTLFRGITDPEIGPCIRAWELNALPRPKRVTEFILPVILRTKTRDLRGNQAHFSPLEEVRHLEDLASSSRLVLYQEGSATYDVRVASLAISEGDVRSWQDPIHTDELWFETTALVRLLSKEA